MAGGRIAEVRLALGGVATKPWRARAAERAARRRPGHHETFTRAAEAELAPAVPHGMNAFKIELARRTMVRAWRRSAQRGGDRHEPGDRPAPSTGWTAATRYAATRATRPRSRVTNLAHAVVVERKIASGRITAIDTSAGRAGRGCAGRAHPPQPGPGSPPCRGCSPRWPGWPRRGRPSSRCRTRSSTTAASRSPSWSPTPSSAPTTRRTLIRIELRDQTPRPPCWTRAATGRTSRSGSSAACCPGTRPRGDVAKRRWPRREVCVDATYRFAPTTTTRSSRRPPPRSGRTSTG